MARLNKFELEMYMTMIEEEFGPILRMISAAEATKREQITRDVRMSLGIYELYSERLQLKDRLAEIDNQLKDYESKRHTPSGFKSMVDEMVEDRMRSATHGIGQQIRDLKDSAIKKIRLVGCPVPITNVFNDLPKKVEELSGQLRRQIAADLEEQQVEKK